MWIFINGNAFCDVSMDKPLNKQLYRRPFHTSWRSRDVTVISCILTIALEPAWQRTGTIHLCRQRGPQLDMRYNGSLRPRRPQVRRGGNAVAGRLGHPVHSDKTTWNFYFKSRTRYLWTYIWIMVDVKITSFTQFRNMDMRLNQLAQFCWLDGHCR